MWDQLDLNPLHGYLVHASQVVQATIAPLPSNYGADKGLLICQEMT
jgi:hypothetical protein